MTTDARGPRVVGFDSTFMDLAQESGAFESLGSYASQAFTLTGAGDAGRIRGEIVSASYFPTLGVTPVIGRLFLDEEDGTPGSHPVAVVSESLWRSRLSARADVIGSVIFLNRVPLTVVGVLPSSFMGESGEASVWIPRAMDRAVLHGQSRMFTAIVGRLRSGVTPSQADAEVRRLVSGMPDAARLAALPRIESVTRVRHLPVRERGTVTSIRLDGDADRRHVGYNAVDPDGARCRQASRCRHIVREGLTVCAIGLAFGVSGALVTARSMRALLYETSRACTA